jgi:SAM-dependent methyltransferase
MALYDQTIDWTTYWEQADETDRSDADPSGTYTRDPVFEFFEERGVPTSYADVGCGPATVPFSVAEQYPDTRVVGYDAASPVIERNRARVTERDLDTLRFEQATLPEFAPDEQFEVVSSFYTLCYVPEIEQALQALYDAVEPGGYLLFTYHNEYAQSYFESVAADPHAVLDKDDAWDPDHFADRFAAVLSGESVLSYRKIHDILGTWPQSLWSVADTERYPAWRQNPLVFVPKS